MHCKITDHYSVYGSNATNLAFNTVFDDNQLSILLGKNIGIIIRSEPNHM